MGAVEFERFNPRDMAEVLVNFVLSHDNRATVMLLSKSKSFHDRRSVGQSVLVSGHHFGPTTNFSFSSTEMIYRHLWFFYVWSALSDERMVL
jgi:hypothetical protein